MSTSGQAESAKLGIGVITIFTIVMVIEYLLISGLTDLPEIYRENPIYQGLVMMPVTMRLAFVVTSIIVFIMLDSNKRVSNLLDKYSIIQTLCWVLFVLSSYLFITIVPERDASYIIGFPIIFFSYYITGYICFNMVRRSKPNLLKEAFGIKKVNYFDYNKYSFNWKSKKEGFINVRNPFRGLLIIGNAGSGKGWKGIEPIIDQIVWKGYTGLVYDFKSPVLTKYLHNQFHNYRIKLNDVRGEYPAERRKLWMVDFADLSRSHRCNPISPKYMQTASDANEMAITLLSNLSPSMISKPDFFNSSAVVILKTLFWWLRLEAPELCTIPHAVAMAQMPYEKLIAMLKTNEETSPMIEVLAMADRKKAEGQLAGQVASLLIPADKINSPEISYVLSEDDFSLKLNDPDNPAILCLGNNVQRVGTYGPVVALIATVVMKQLNAENRLHSVFALDEAPTIYIPDYDKAGPATARSNKVSHIYICQSTSQIKDKYGDVKADTITDTLGNQFYLQCNLKDAKVISQTLGVMKEEMQTVSTSKNDKTTGNSYSIQNQNLLKDEEIARLEVGRIIGKVAESVKGKYESIFNVLPDTPEKQRNHELSAFVKMKSESGENRPMTHSEVYEIAIKKHKYITWQAKVLVDEKAREAVKRGIAQEKTLFPEHFDGDTRKYTLWDDPIDADGYIRDKNTNIIVGHKSKGYFETVNIENES